MLDDALLEIMEAALKPFGFAHDEGVEFRAPVLTILRFYYRPVRLHWLPFLGRALSVVAVIRQPADLGFSAEGCRQCLKRVAMAANGLFPPWKRGGGVSIALTTIALTPEPIGPQDDSILQTALGSLPRMRSIPLGLIRVNLGQEAMSFALSSGPGDLFPEPVALADALTPHFRRYVQSIEV
jgi:hypothetical protein